AGGEWIVYTVPIVITAVGDHQLEYRSLDAVGNVEEIHSIDIHIVATTPDQDVKPPTTYIDVSYQLGNHYYKYTADETVEVQLLASDDMSGVLDSVYRINTGLWHTYSGPIILTEEGEYQLEYYSV